VSQNSFWVDTVPSHTRASLHYNGSAAVMAVTEWSIAFAYPASRVAKGKNPEPVVSWTCLVHEQKEFSEFCGNSREVAPGTQAA
jgi:hypothetical protein